MNSTQDPYRPVADEGRVVLEPRGSPAGRLVLLVLALAAMAGALWLMFRKGQETASQGQGPTPPAAVAGGTSPGSGGGSGPTPAKLVLGVAYGTEKKPWMEWAAQAFAETPEGAGIEVKLIGLGSLESAHRVLRKDESIHVWSPASAAFKETFVGQWQAETGRSPIAREEPLALTPMAFVMWEERYQAFVKKYGSLTFKSAGRAMAEPTGWAAIANQPDWTFFKFGHTHPNDSNSGLMTLVLLAYDHFGKQDRLTGADLTDAEFQTFFERFETGVVAPAGSLVDSTGRLMEDMVRKGPSTYDAVCVYESVAIEQLAKAEGRWRNKLRVAYPRYNVWNDNPYYVLDVPWSTPAHRRAAEAFLKFLLAEPAQRRAMAYGFRPANTAVATAADDSPFVKLKDYGVALDLDRSAICATPRPEVITALLTRWQQVRGGR